MGYLDRIFGRKKDSPGKSRKRGRGSRRRRRVEREIRHVLDIWEKIPWPGPGTGRELVRRFPGKKAIRGLKSRFGLNVFCEMETGTKKKYIVISRENKDGN